MKNMHLGLHVTELRTVEHIVLYYTNKFKLQVFIKAQYRSTLTTMRAMINSWVNWFNSNRLT